MTHMQIKNWAGTSSKISTLSMYICLYIEIINVIDRHRRQLTLNDLNLRIQIVIEKTINFFDFNSQIFKIGNVESICPYSIWNSITEV